MQLHGSKIVLAPNFKALVNFYVHFICYIYLYYLIKKGAICSLKIFIIIGLSYIFPDNLTITVIYKTQIRTFVANSFILWLLRWESCLVLKIFFGRIPIFIILDLWTKHSIVADGLKLRTCNKCDTMLMHFLALNSIWR